MTDLHLDFHPAAARLNFGSAQRVPTGATDYEDLQNLPSINGEELIGDKTAAELGLATPEDIPTDNSELQNGAGYQTEQQVSEAVATAVEPLSNAVSAIEGKIPAAASSSNKLMDAAAVDTAIAEALSGITGIAFEVVQSLPASGEAGTIYLVPHGGSEATDIYDEYVWLSSSRWELLGTTAVDLTGYATEEWVRQQGYGTYTKPAGGIPSGDLAPAVNTALDMARLSLQPGALTPYRTAAEQDVIDAAQNTEIAKTATTSAYGRTRLNSSVTNTSEALAMTPGGINALVNGIIASYPVYTLKDYAVGDRVRYSYAIYECNTRIGSAESWTAAHWTRLPTLLAMIEQGAISIVTVTGTTPTINALPGVRYVCGEVATLDITLPASGIVDVVFESGTTPTVLTVPSTVQFPAWFDATALEADTVYEISIMDGYGAVMSWPI